MIFVIYLEKHFNLNNCSYSKKKIKTNFNILMQHTGTSGKIILIKPWLMIIIEVWCGLHKYVTFFIYKSCEKHCCGDKLLAK